MHCIDTMPRPEDQKETGASILFSAKAPILKAR
jgi:hypothetical protein